MLTCSCTDPKPELALFNEHPASCTQLCLAMGFVNVEGTCRVAKRWRQQMQRGQPGVTVNVDREGQNQAWV